MRKTFLSVSIFGILFLLLLVSPVFAQEKLDIYIGTGCSHCAKVKQFVEDNKEKVEERFEVEFKDTYANNEYAAELDDLFNQAGASDDDRGVPAIFVDGKPLTGDTPIIEYIESEIDVSDEDGSSSSSNDIIVFGVAGGVIALTAGLLYFMSKKN